MRAQPYQYLPTQRKCLAYNEQTNDFGLYPITAVWIEDHDLIVYLIIDGELIVTTPEHPFFTDTLMQIPAGNLLVGDRIWQNGAGYGVVEAVLFVSQPQVMYNLTVDQAHTFFVGDGGWLVHNTCKWLGEGKAPRYGIGLAQLADRIYKQIDFWPRRNSTIAVSSVSGQIYVTSFGDSRAAKQLKEIADANGYTYLANGTTDHAEVFLYKKLKDLPDFNGIGVSHYAGPCKNVCRPFFKGASFAKVF